MRHAVHPPPESLIHRRSGQQMMMVGTLAFQPPAPSLLPHTHTDTATSETCCLSCSPSDKHQLPLTLRGGW